MTWQIHPGYQKENMRDARERWWSTLATHSIGIVGLGYGSGGYTMAKYVEYLYAGLLLLAERPGPEDCELLGLRHMENCILFDWPAEQRYFVDTYAAALRDFRPFVEIARKGQQLARRRHTAGSRIKYLQIAARGYKATGHAPPWEEQLHWMSASEKSEDGDA